MDVTMQTVTEADAPFLHLLMNDEHILDALKEIPTKVDDWSEAIAAWKGDPDEEDYIIFHNQTPIGWLGVNGLLSEEKTAYIKMIALLPPFQNKGVGSYAVHWCTDHLKSRGFKKIILYTDQSNLRAQKCYEKSGFTIAEALTEEMSNGEIVARYKMELEL